MLFENDKPNIIKIINSKISLLQLPAIARLSPFIIGLLLFMRCILATSYNSIYLFIMYILVVVSNCIAKRFIFKPIYDLYYGKYKTNTIPILGIGSRPYNGDDTNDTNDTNDTTFGMPSCHSQVAWFITTYIICKLFYEKLVILIVLFALCILLILLAFYISYSRVYIEKCHTIQQVIIGGILGIIAGLIIFFVEYNLIVL